MWPAGDLYLARKLYVFTLKTVLKNIYIYILLCLVFLGSSQNFMINLCLVLEMLSAVKDFYFKKHCHHVAQS